MLVYLQDYSWATNPAVKQVSKQASFQLHQLPDLAHHATKKACARQGKGQNPNFGSNLH